MTMARRRGIRSADIHLFYSSVNLRDEFVATLSEALRERLAKHRPSRVIGGHRTYYSLPIQLANALARDQMLWDAAQRRSIV
jgi:hypothetical protein